MHSFLVSCKEKNSNLWRSNFFSKKRLRWQICSDCFIFISKVREEQGFIFKAKVIRSKVKGSRTSTTTRRWRHFRLASFVSRKIKNFIQRKLNCLKSEMSWTLFWLYSAFHPSTNPLWTIILFDKTKFLTFLFICFSYLSIWIDSKSIARDSPCSID